MGGVSAHGSGHDPRRAWGVRTEPLPNVFGRHRSLAGIPYQPTHEAEDAPTFMKRVKANEETVATRLNEAHDKRNRNLNAHRSLPPRLEPDAKVW